MEIEDATVVSIYALDVASGAMIWKYPLQSGSGYTLPLIAEDVVYVGNKDSIDALDMKTGELLWQVEVDSEYEYYEEQFP